MSPSRGHIPFPCSQSQKFVHATRLTLVDENSSKRCMHAYYHMKIRISDICIQVGLFQTGLFQLIKTCKMLKIERCTTSQQPSVNVTSVQQRHRKSVTVKRDHSSKFTSFSIMKRSNNTIQDTFMVQFICTCSTVRYKYMKSN